MKGLIELLKETFAEFSADGVPRLGAALAYYTVFSLAPLLVVAVAVAGFFLDEASAQAELMAQANAFFGPQVAETLDDLIANATRPGTGVLATIIGIATLLLGASGIFGELQATLNLIWGVSGNDRGGILAMIRKRLVAFALVLGSGGLLLGSLVLSTVLSVINQRFDALLPGAGGAWQLLNQAISLILLALVFATIYKVVPDVRVGWRAVLVGGLVTSLLFSLGRYLIGLYLAGGASTSVYGAAGSLALLLLWIYYTAQIVLLGAEFTQVYARQTGQLAKPSGGATAVRKARGSHLREPTNPSADPSAKGDHHGAARSVGAAAAPLAPSPVLSQAARPRSGLGALLGALAAAIAVGWWAGRGK